MLGSESEPVPGSLARFAPSHMTAFSALYHSTLGKKYIMALSGAGLFGFVVVHMLGNLQVFLGPEPLNHYAVFLKSKPLLLWGARLGLLLLVLQRAADQEQTHRYSTSAGNRRRRAAPARCGVAGGPAQDAAIPDGAMRRCAQASRAGPDHASDRGSRGSVRA